MPSISAALTICLDAKMGVADGGPWLLRLLTMQSQYPEWVETDVSPTWPLPRAATGNEHTGDQPIDARPLREKPDGDPLIHMKGSR